MNEKPKKENPVTTPYVGLMPFTEKEAVYFFGRTVDQEIVATNLRAARLTIFYGASGVGKSSLLNAGVLPYLKHISTVSILPDEPPEFILVVLREWANNPIDSLRLRISEAVETAVNERKIPHIKPEDVRKTALANEHNCNLSELLKNWTDLIKTSLLIIFDQFEDFFLHPEFTAGAGSFGEEFPKALNNKELHVNYMISMRDDALSKLDFFKGKIQDSMKNTLRLLHLDRNATAEAICKPLEKYNEIANTSFTIEKGLVKKLLDDLQVDKVKFDTQGQAAVNQVDAVKSETQTVSNGYRVETPYLQLVMERLWRDEITQNEKHLTLDTLENKLGGVQKIVETHLDEVMNQFNDEDKELASEFIHFTVTRSGAKIPWDVNDLADFAELLARKQDIKRILDRLCTGESRIFKAVPNRRNPQSPFYEVSHDALGPAILSWRKRINDIKLNKLAFHKAEEKRRIELAEIQKTRQEELEKERQQKEEQARKLQAEQERRENQEKLLEAERKSRKLGRMIVAVVISFLVIVAIASAFVINYIKDMRLQNAHDEVVKEKEEVNKEKEEVVKDKEKVVEKAVAEVKDKVDKAEKTSRADKDVIQSYVDQVRQYQSLLVIANALQSGKAESIETVLPQLKEKAEKDELPKEYKSLFTNLLKSDKIPPQSVQLRDETLAAIEKSKPKNEKPTGASPTIIFIHIQNRGDANAEKVKALLRKNDYLVPGIETVGPQPDIKQSQIRYFRKTDEGTAEEISKFLAQHGITAKPRHTGGFENSPLVRPKQFELWFTADPIPNVQ